MYKDKNFYLNLFQVSEAQLERLAADGLKGGGSYCDLFFENTTTICCCGTESSPQADSTSTTVSESGF